MSRRLTHNSLVLGVVALLCASHMVEASPEPPDGTLLEALGERSDEMPPAALLRAALEAGGCCQGTIERSVDVFDEFCRELQTRLMRQTDRQKAECLYREMHGRILTGSFQPYCYRLDATLNGKSYNCLTSTILYMCLCRAFDLHVIAIEDPSHLYCHLHLDKPLDVQTTSAHWFQDDQPPHRSSGLQVNSSGRELDDQQLLARIHYNRGTSLLVQHEPERALRCLQRSHLLDRHNPATRQNLITACNDWSLQLCERQQFAESVAALQSGLQLDPGNPITLSNDVHIHHCWVTAMCARHQFLDALCLLEQCHRRRSEVEFFDQGRWVVCCAWATSLMETGRWSDAWNVFTLARQRHPENEELRASEAAFWSHEVKNLRQLGRHAEAVQLSRWLKHAKSNLTRVDL